MAENDYLKFKGIEHIGNQSMINILEINLKAWYDWCLLKIGGWDDVAIDNNDIYGGNKSILRPVDDKEFGSTTNATRVWEAVKKDWVYEAGINYIDIDGNTLNPVAIGNPIVNGSTVSSGFYIDYVLGRVIFDTAISKSSVVKIAYSYRTVQIYRADNAPWFTELQYRTYKSIATRTDDDDFKVGAQIRNQMPCIIIEAVPRGTSKGYEIGSGSQLRTQDVLFHVLAETRTMRNNLLDYCAAQCDKEIWLFNHNSVANNGLYALDYRNMKINNNNYDDFVSENGYRWRKCFFKDVIITEMNASHPELYQGVVRTSCEILFGSV